MGSVRFGIPRDLVLALKAKHGIEYFFETGTLEGHTAQWAAEYFKCVTTVDINQTLVNSGNLNAFEADSADFMAASSFPNPDIFWLDAHTDEICPVLSEIESINKSPLPHVILVDDVRLFGNRPNWPSKQEVIDYLLNDGKRTVYEIEDVLVAEPCP